MKSCTISVFLLMTTFFFLFSCGKDKATNSDNNTPQNTSPNAFFTVNPDSGTTETVFNVDASGSSDNQDSTSALQVRWDWENDGTYDTEWSNTKTASHQYMITGTKAIKLEVKDTGGLTDTDSSQVTVGNTAPTASFTVIPTLGTTDNVFAVDASGSTDNEDSVSVLEVRWDWENDGTYDADWTTTKTASHQYSTSGTKTIKLEVKDTGGMTDTETHQVMVSYGGETVTDIDGNVYRTVTIGGQVWMAENLKVTHYRNGNPIPNVTDDTDWSNWTTGAYCNYNNNVDNASIYGRLYNWYAVSDNRCIAPEGWHVPSDEEWKQLEMYLGMSPSEADDEGWRGTDEGGKMKEAGNSHWESPNTGATNESGFTALPGGYRHSGSGFFDNLGWRAEFWAFTESSSNFAWCRILWCISPDVDRGSLRKRNGFSVRCVRD